MSRSETNKAPTSRLQYLGDIRHPIFKINKETKWANITLFKQNSNFVITWHDFIYVLLRWFFKDKILSKFQIILDKQIKQNNNLPK